MSSPRATSSATRQEEESSNNNNKNEVYIMGLLKNLESALDKYILTGSPASKIRAQNIVQQIQRESQSPDLIQRSLRMTSRAGLSLENNAEWMQEGTLRNEQRRQEMQTRKDWENTDWGNSNAAKRQEEAQERQTWEKTQQKQSKSGTAGRGGTVANQMKQGRSALSRRGSKQKPDVFMSSVDSNLDPQSLSQDKAGLEETLERDMNRNEDNVVLQDDAASQAAAVEASALVASAGAGSAFEGQNLGIGGLDDVLAQVKRRVWVPLAAPPQLLQELGINPVRGLLLYGMPGCGKTLVARTIGKILSPARPITVVSGPELMDKFVGSSEKNLREVFDNPPDIYDSYRLGAADGGEAMSRAALHVIVMDEFDAMARTRGGRDGKGDQGDAGVARDSVVNQLLAKMDGVDPLGVPTLVIGLTNKRSLVEPALLRPGRFEVQIEVPPPRTMEQRISILRVHTKSMFGAGRVLVSDAPKDTAASRYIERNEAQDILTYDELLELLATECEGMSGAMLAGVARAAASHALERAVCDFSGHLAQGEDGDDSILDCLVTQADFELAVQDVLESSGDSDWEGSAAAEEEELSTKDKPKDAEMSQDIETASGTSL